MGCCVSTSDKSSRSSPPKVSAESIAPPSVEEETVKEVLSETPKWKPSVAKFEAEKQTVAKFEVEKPHQKPTVAEFEGESKVEKVMMALEISKGEEEISEVCSLSESMSTTTLTEEEPRQRVHRSPAKMNKYRSFSGEFGGGGGGRGKSPARRTEQSPGQRNVRVVQSRDQMRNQPPVITPAGDLCRRRHAPIIWRLDPSWVGFRLREELTNLLLGSEQPRRRMVAGKGRVRRWSNQQMSRWKTHLCHWNASSFSRVLPSPMVVVWWRHHSATIV